MSKKLQNDDISLSIDLRAQQAEETTHRLTKNIENLRKQNTEHRKEISRLAATEGDYSAEIKRLNEEIRKNAKEIEANKRSIQSERSEIDLSRMSAADLGKELKRLKKELANTSKSLHREEYRKLEKEIRQTEKAYAEATRSTRGFFTSLMSLDKIATPVKGFFMGLGMVITTYVVGAFKNLIDTIQDFRAFKFQTRGRSGYVYRRNFTPDRASKIFRAHNYSHSLTGYRASDGTCKTRILTGCN